MKLVRYRIPRQTVILIRSMATPGIHVFFPGVGDYKKKHHSSVTHTYTPLRVVFSPFTKHGFICYKTGNLPDGIFVTGHGIL